MTQQVAKELNKNNNSNNGKEDKKITKTEKPAAETTTAKASDKGATSCAAAATTTKGKASSKGAQQTNGVVDVEWNKLLLQYINERREQRNEGLVPIVWNDACHQQALIVAKDNADKEHNKYGVKEDIKAALKAEIPKFKGTFKVTTQTMDLTNQGSTNEALNNLYNSSGHWGMLMNPEAVIGGFAAVQKGDTVYWMGICVKLHPGKKN